MNSTHSHLPRLERDAYQGQSYVHWVNSIQDRRTGWLTPVFYYRFRELLAHTAFRYSIACPIFCLMPDHIHLLWIGIHDGTDQRNAMTYFRKHVRDSLRRIGYDLQHQPYDHVLRSDERQPEAIASLVEYIARNPERKGLVPRDAFASYKYTSSMVPGYPELSIRLPGFWDRFWRCYVFLREKGSIRFYDEP